MRSLIIFVGVQSRIHHAEPVQTGSRGSAQLHESSSPIRMFIYPQILLGYTRYLRKGILFMTKLLFVLGQNDGK